MSKKRGKAALRRAMMPMEEGECPPVRTCGKGKAASMIAEGVLFSLSFPGRRKSKYRSNLLNSGIRAREEGRGLIPLQSAAGGEGKKRRGERGPTSTFFTGSFIFGSFVMRRGLS